MYGSCLHYSERRQEYGGGRRNAGSAREAAQDEQEIAAVRKTQAAGESQGPIDVRYTARLAELAVPE